MRDKVNGKCITVDHKLHTLTHFPQSGVHPKKLFSPLNIFSFFIFITDSFIVWPQKQNLLPLWQQTPCSIFRLKWIYKEEFNFEHIETDLDLLTSNARWNPHLYVFLWWKCGATWLTRPSYRRGSVVRKASKQETGNDVLLPALRVVKKSE